VMLGYNFRMSTMTAALGMAQMEKIDKLIHMRRENANYLTQRLLEIEEIEPPKEPSSYFHVYQMYTIRINGKEGIRDRLKGYLVQHGIGAKVYFDPVHLTQFYRREFGFREGCLPLTEKVATEVLTLPMYPTLTREEMDYIVQQIEDFFAKGAK